MSLDHAVFTTVQQRSYRYPQRLLSQFTDVENEAQRREDILPKATQPRSDPDGTQAWNF